MTAVPSTLKKISAHPIFPQVKIVHAPVPYLAGSSEDMKTVYIDPRVPTTINVNGKIIPTAAPLAVHELYERMGIQILLAAIQTHQYQPSGHTTDQIHGDVYSVAHEHVGNIAEMHFLQQHYGFSEADWGRYQQIMHEIAQKTEKESPKGAPKDLYTFMYPHAEAAGIAHNHNHYGEGVQNFAAGGAVNKRMHWYKQTPDQNAPGEWDGGEPQSTSEPNTSEEAPQPVPTESLPSKRNDPREENI